MPDAAALQPVDVDRIGRIWLREGTSDYAVLEQIFHTEEFNISTAPQFAWIRAVYDCMLAGGETPLVIVLDELLQPQRREACRCKKKRSGKVGSGSWSGCVLTR
jgi:hypothetical protein